MNLKRNIPAIVVLVMGGAFTTCAQQTNAPAQLDYSFFRMIADRNIFDPNRYPRQGRSPQREARRTPQGDAFSLVGTMSYQKGTFAFFDGTSSEYRKVLQIDEAIAGYKVGEIAPNAVILEANGKEIEIKVGAEMRREVAGEWQLIAQADLPSQSAETATAETSADKGVDSGSGGEANDVLRKLMQQREQELK